MSGTNSILNLLPAAEIGVILAPIPISIGIYRLAVSVWHGWLVHRLLVPILLAIEFILNDLLLFVARCAGDNEPSAGLFRLFLAVLSAVVISVVVVTAVAYYVIVGLDVAIYISAKRRRARREAMRAVNPPINRF